MKQSTRRVSAALAAAMFLTPALASAQGPGALTPPRGVPAAPAAPKASAPARPTSGSTSDAKSPGDVPAPRAADRLPQGTISDDYILQTGDKLRIEVYKDAQLSQSVQIRPDGKITLPLVGDVAATGLTPLALRDRITTSLRDFVNNPVVTVIVVEGTAPTAYIIGEVNSPGMVTLLADMTVLQAIAMAGGLRDFADTKRIRILRKKGSGTETLTFNYKEAIKGGSATTMMLQPGDTVVVPD